MSKIKAAFLGIAEFRLTYTTSFDDIELCFWYDVSREWAHKLTFRHFEA